MKIKALVPMWRRPEVVKMFLYYFKRNAPSYAELDMTPILSDEDPHFNTLRELVKDYDYLVYPNNPLGTKKNAGLAYALEDKWDYLMDLGSDDIFAPILWDIYRPYFGNEMFGLCNLYIYDIINSRAIFLRKYANAKQSETFGACRMIRRDVCERVKLWNEFNSGLDGVSRQNMLSAGVKETVIDTDRACVVVDLKTNTNIHTFMEIEGRGEEVDVDWLEENFELYHDIEHPEIFRCITVEGFHNEVCRRSGSMRKSDAFNQVNTEYRMSFGIPRYKNYNSYCSHINQVYGKRNHSL